MTAPRTLRPRARPRRDGFVIGLVVFGGLLFLALAIYPTLFFSGSQTRSEALSANRWRGRVLARGGLKLGASLLRKQRWWDTPTGSSAPSIGTKTSEELGVPASAGRFQLVAESVIAPYPGDQGVSEEDIPPHLRPDSAGGEPWNPLERVDLFVRAEIDDDTVVAYGAFVVSPRPRFHGQETIMAGGSSRLVRVQFFTGSEFQAVEDASVRQRIRAAVRAQRDVFLANYAVVNFRATPANQATGPMGDGQATAFMEQWLRPAVPDARAAYMRDRIFDALFEGTPVNDRPTARESRDLRANLQACSGEALQVIAEATWFCANDMEGDCTWADPACLTPRQWDYDSDDTSAETVLHQREADLDDASVDGGYISRMASTEKILREYEYSCDVVEFLDRPPQPPDADGDGVYENSSGVNDPGVGWPPAPSPSGPGKNLPAAFWPDFCPAGDPNDKCWCVNVQGNVTDPLAGVAYILTDEVTGYEQRLDEVASYFQRQLLGAGETVDSGTISFNRYRSGSTGIVDDDHIIDDDGDVDDDGVPNGDDPDFTPPPSPPPEDDGDTSPPTQTGSGSFGGGGTF